jgi:hypothetical protein
VRKIGERFFFFFAKYQAIITVTVILIHSSHASMRSLSTDILND